MAIHTSPRNITEYLQKKNLPPAQHHVEYVFDSFVMNREFPSLKVRTTYRSDRYWCGEHAAGITTTPKEAHEAFFPGGYGL